MNANCIIKRAFDIILVIRARATLRMYVYDIVSFYAEQQRQSAHDFVILWKISTAIKLYIALQYSYTILETVQCIRNTHIIIAVLV